MVLLLLGLVALFWHRGVIAAKQLPAVMWVSGLGRVFSTSDSFTAPTELFDRVRHQNSRSLPARLVLSADSLYLLPNRLRPGTAMRLPLSDLRELTLTRQGGKYLPAIRLLLQDGREGTLAFEGDRTLIRRLISLGAQSGEDGPRQGLSTDASVTATLAGHSG